MEQSPVDRPSDLLKVYADLQDRWTRYTSHEVRVRRRRGNVTHRQFALVYGLAAHTYETGRLLEGALDKAPLTAAGFPLLRAIFESAVTAQWVAHVDDAAQALSNEYSRNQGNLRDAFLRSNVPSWRDFSASVPDVDLPSEETASARQGKVFEQRCLDLQSGAELYAVYRIMSGWCHPGVRVCDEYVMLPESDDSVVLRQRARAMSATRSWTRITISCLLWSARAVTYLAPDDEYRNYLRGVARTLNVDIDMQPSSAAYLRAARRKKT